MTLDWWHKHCQDQVVCLLKLLGRRESKVSQMLQQSIMQHTLWQGGDQAGLAGPYNQDRGWSGMLLGRLHMWMTEMHLEIQGPAKYTDIPWGREGDILLLDLLPRERTEDRAMLAAGAWIVEAWRVSDVTDSRGGLLDAACAGGLWETQIQDVEGKGIPGWGASWGVLLREAVRCWGMSEAMGGRLRGSIREGTFVCAPGQQRGAHHPDERCLVISLVIRDEREKLGWDDTV